MERAGKPLPLPTEPADIGAMRTGKVFGIWALGSKQHNPAEWGHANSGGRGSEHCERFGKQQPSRRIEVKDASGGSAALSVLNRHIRTSGFPCS